MKRKIVAAGAGIAVGCFLVALLASRGDALRKDLSTTHRVEIDGKSFVRDDAPSGDSDPIPGSAAKGHPVFSGRLKESPGNRSGIPFPLPRGFTVDRSIRLEGEGKPVDLAIGRLEVRGPSVRSRLLSEGWEAASSPTEPGIIRVLRIRHGKESAVVCLDETEGAFLFFREGGR